MPKNILHENKRSRSLAPRVWKTNFVMFRVVVGLPRVGERCTTKPNIGLNAYESIYDVLPLGLWRLCHLYAGVMREYWWWLTPSYHLVYSQLSAMRNLVLPPLWAPTPYILADWLQKTKSYLFIYIFLFESKLSAQVIFNN
jgi:hypothetical protein